MRTVEKNFIDWTAIKRAWVKNTVSIRALAKQHKVPESTIRKRAREKDWPPRGAQEGAQKGAQASAKTKAEPRENASHERVDPSPAAAPSPTMVKAADGSIDLAKSGKALLEMLMQELHLASAHPDFLEQVIAEETHGDRSPKRRQLLLRIVSLPTRIQAARNLASALALIAEAGPGKKQQRDEDAKTAGEGSEWGDLLDPYSADRGVGRAN